MTYKIQTAQNTFIDTHLRRQVNIKGIEFAEDFIAELIASHFASKGAIVKPTFATAFEIYMRESNAPIRRKFTENATRNFNYFQAQFGDLPLDELRHVNGTQFRDAQLARGLNPTSVRKQFATLNAVLNLSFKHLDIDRLSPFRAMYIQGVGDFTRPMQTITPALLDAVKQRLLGHVTPYRLVGLIQLNTGLRLSEPIFARLEDCVLDHQIPHLWIRKNSLSDRKTKSSIRCVPLIGVSLDAAKKLHAIATDAGSEWFVPRYARYNGSTTCSATMNKCLLDLGFRTHMFRHALIDRMKACNDIPTRLAESITGHHSGGSDFNSYGTVGYTLEQKLAVLNRVLV
jgi:integrase